MTRICLAILSARSMRGGGHSIKTSGKEKATDLVKSAALCDADRGDPDLNRNDLGAIDFQTGRGDWRSFEPCPLEPYAGLFLNLLGPDLRALRRLMQATP